MSKWPGQARHGGFRYPKGARCNLTGAELLWAAEDLKAAARVLDGELVVCLAPLQL